MVRKRNNRKLHLLNPLVLSSLFSLVVIFSNIFEIQEHYDFKAPIENETITRLYGNIRTSPVKKGSGKFYKADFSSDAFENKNGVQGTCKGTINILIPSDIVECHFPGKLYSIINTEKGTICEQGLYYEISGFFIDENTFRTDSIKRLRSKNRFSNFYYKRALFRIHFRRLMFAWGPAGGLLLALLSGIKEYTDDTLSFGFRNAGLSHILALSGMHLNLFSNLALKIGKKLSGAILSAILQTVSVAAFVLFAGFSPSLFRAFLCCILSSSVTILKLKDVKKIHVLSACFLIHISLKPYEIFETAFLLSYGALAGILVISEFIKILFIIKTPGPLSDSLSSSSAAQIFTIPVSLKILGTFAPGGIIATMFISPLITFFIYSGLTLILLCMIFPFFVPYTVFLEKIFYTVIKTTVLFFAKIPFYSAGP